MNEYATFLVLMALTGSCAGMIAAGIAGSISRSNRCVTACEKREGVFEHGSGICTCLDGSVWVWQEGYTYRLGKAGGK